MSVVVFMLRAMAEEMAVVFRDMLSGMLSTLFSYWLQMRAAFHHAIIRSGSLAPGVLAFSDCDI